MMQRWWDGGLKTIKEWEVYDVGGEEESLSNCFRLVDILKCGP